MSWKVIDLLIDSIKKTHRIVHRARFEWIATRIDHVAHLAEHTLAGRLRARNRENTTSDASETWTETDELKVMTGGGND